VSRKRLNLGLVGCGLRGGFHSRAIRGLSRLGLLDLNYAVVCDVDEQRARSFAKAAGVERIATDPLDVLDDPDVDVVYVTVPTAGHKELVLRAAANGKHIFCEKPLATNLTDVREMVDAVDRAGVKAGVGLILRHSPILTLLKSLTEDPTLGRLMTVVFRDDQFFPIQGHYGSEWRKDKRIVGAGTLLEHSIHDVDVLRWFGGEVTHVRGVTRNFAGYEGVEDLASAQIEFESGALADLVSVWHSVLGRPSTRRIEIFMEKGVFFVDNDFLGPIHLQKHAQNSQVISEDEVRTRYLAALGLDSPEFETALRYAFEDFFFLKAVSEDTVPFPDFHVALEAHRVVDAVYRSASSGGADTVLA
jgi:predicted dehydrogenase